MRGSLLVIFALESLLKFLESQGRRWVTRVRRLHRASARTLTPIEKNAVSPFFDPTLLETVRITSVAGIENPDFYSFLLQQSVAIPLDFTQMSAITFVDTILVSELHPVQPGAEIALLFHELVHVVQYSELGVDEFVRRYIRGWASNGFEYVKIPLERSAYELQSRFSSGGPAFSVVAEVRRHLKAA